MIRTNISCCYAFEKFTEKVNALLSETDNYKKISLFDEDSKLEKQLLEATFYDYCAPYNDAYNIARRLLRRSPFIGGFAHQSRRIKKDTPKAERARAYNDIESFVFNVALLRDMFIRARSSKEGVKESFRDYYYTLFRRVTDFMRRDENARFGGGLFLWALMILNSDRKLHAADALFTESIGL